ncbi:MAG: CDP-diacylglycerol--serine O-phosphatidyltransferase [Muribaculaceae bacterium]|nr:CDP-diacylglycerol--serine O-phosphatidyltransferase [Muribaculaceae bacterium]
MLKSIKNNIPNAVTCLNLICGTLAVVAAFRCQETLMWGMKGYQVAFLLIALGAVADFCDGLVARALHAASGIGRELDSLSDLVSFGLAPAMVVYNLVNTAYPGSPWCLVTVMIPLCGALRLARFNVDTEQTTTFKGMPIPANAIFWIGYAAGLTSFMPPLWGVVAMVLLFPLLMVTSWRMFSFKMHGFGLRESWAQFLLIIAAVALIASCGLVGLKYTIYAYVALSAAKNLVERGSSCDSKNNVNDV